MISLLDVNVLVALAWPNHVHHDLALDWFLRNRKGGWASCPTTQSGFLRVSSNRLVLPGAPSPQEAKLLLRKIVSQPGHTFWPDATDLTRSPFVDWARVRGHRQISDAHLLALALSKKGRLATLDQGLADLVPAGTSREKAMVLLTETERKAG